MTVKVQIRRMTIKTVQVTRGTRANEVLQMVATELGITVPELNAMDLEREVPITQNRTCDTDLRIGIAATVRGG